MDMLPFCIALLMVYLVAGILLAEGCKRASRKAGDDFTDGSYRMTVLLWPMIFYAMVRSI